VEPLCALKQTPKNLVEQQNILGSFSEVGDTQLLILSIRTNVEDMLRLYWSITLLYYISSKGDTPLHDLD
jgi:hypothetical protein